MTRQVVVLADNLNPWHTLWVRLGQYFHHLPIHYEALTEADVTRDGLGLCLNLPRQPDCLVLYRFAPSTLSLLFLDLLVSLKVRGCRIIADIDDDLWSQEARPTLGKQEWPRERLAMLNRVLRLVDRITVSTPELQMLMTVMFPDQPVQVVPNTVPHTVPPSRPPRSPDAPLRLGWTGAPWTRPHDLALLKPLAACLKNESWIRWVHVGHDPNRVSLAQILGLPEDRVETYPVQPHATYLHCLHFDVGLAPLADTLFNTYKSDLKLLEYSAAGIPWLASDAPPYRDLAEAWNAQALLCRHPDQFIAGVERWRSIPHWFEARERLMALSQTRSFQAGLKCWSRLLGVS
jgi:glycosyltransferase involved in cell wall biosynthesis